MAVKKEIKLNADSRDERYTRVNGRSEWKGEKMINEEKAKNLRDDTPLSELREICETVEDLEELLRRLSKKSKRGDPDVSE